MKTIQPLSPQSNDDPADISKQVDNLLQDSTHTYATPDRHAAAKIVREQIDREYDTNPPNQLKDTGASQESSPYQRTHSQNALQNSDQADIWKEYHSAWQDYYKQYYQRYYLQQLLQTEQKDAPKSASPAAAEESVTPKQATDQIKNEILEKIKKQTSTVRHSVHFMPIVTAVVIGFLFLFVQYNRLFAAQLTAYVSPGSATSQNIILDPVTNTKVGPEPRIVIPKINVDAPIVYGVKSLRENDIQSALRNGVVHYPYPGADSLPGQVGNTVLLGHTSNDVFDPGGYKFVFVLMERLKEGDTIYLHYKGTRYTYLVSQKKVVDPEDIKEIVIDTNKPLVTLIGCVPVGTANQRLLITGEQISPDPTKATPPRSNAKEQTQPEALPGEGQTFLERLFN
jgi:sortase A